MPNRSLPVFAILAAAVVAVLIGRSRLGTGPATSTPTSTPGSTGHVSSDRPDSSDSPALSHRSDVGFHSRERLEEHYRKHGREFGDVSLEQYLQMAKALRDKPAGGPILEAVGQRDGHAVVSKFDKVGGSFIAFDRDDGVIRTFFRPNDGEAYFHRQAAREGHEVGGDASRHDDSKDAKREEW